MKNSFFLFALLFLLFSCSEDSFDIQESSSQPDPFETAQLNYETYVKTHGEPVIEFISLTELNEFNVAHGMPQLTRENFTEDEWAFLQNPDEYAQARCTSGFTAFIGDMAGNGSFSTFDIWLAQVGVNQAIGCPDTWSVPSQYRRYGFFDAMAPYESFDLDGNHQLTKLDQSDIAVSQAVVLGLLPCL